MWLLQELIFACLLMIVSFSGKLRVLTIKTNLTSVFEMFLIGAASFPWFLTLKNSFDANNT